MGNEKRISNKNTYNDGCMGRCGLDILPRSIQLNRVNIMKMTGAAGFIKTREDLIYLCNRQSFDLSQFYILPKILLYKIHYQPYWKIRQNIRQKVYSKEEKANT